MAEFIIGIPGKICCPEKCNAEVTVGDQIRVVMDVAKYPGITVTGIDLTVAGVVPGTVCDPDTGTLEAGKHYTVTVPDDEMPGGLKQIELCDIVSWKCRGCCEDLLDLINEVDAEVSDWSSASGISNEGDNTITVTLSAGQIAAGYTTSHIIGEFYESLGDVDASEIAKTDTLSKTATQVVFRLSGIEPPGGSHKITLSLRK